MISIGVAGRLAKKLIAHAPKWAVEDHGQFEVWITPSTPTWEYHGEPPYRLIRSDMVSADVYGYEEHRHMVEAVVSFANNHLPRDGEVCVLVDANSQIMLGWFHKGDALRWGGCRHGFTVLAGAMQNDPTVVLWEADAKAGHDRLMFGKVIHDND